MSTWGNKWALVTGASAGIGRALAIELAGGGTHLILTARRRDRLEDLAAHIRSLRDVRIELFPFDLARPNAPDEIFAFTKGQGIDLDLLVNNAGFGAYGDFYRADLARHLEMIQVNISAVVHLTRLYLPRMVERRRGDILSLASTAAFQAVPFITTYAATKAFDLLFGEGLAEEVRPYGVRVCVLCPGSTITEFHAVAGQPKRTQRRQETPEKVARSGLRALAAGKSVVISGAANAYRRRRSASSRAAQSRALRPRCFVLANSSDHRCKLSC